MTIDDILFNETMKRSYALGGKFKRDADAFIGALYYRNIPKLISILNESIAYHKGGKVQGIQSLDSSAHCDFCKAMRNTDNVGCICSHCYDFKQETGHKGLNVLPRHYLTMLLLSTIEYDETDLKYLNFTTKYVRFNSSGDVNNDIHAINLFKIAKVNPSINFTLWFKNVKSVKAACIKIGKPNNLRLIYSNPVINGNSTKPVFADNIFTVYTDDRIADALAHCNECNGKKCIECGYKCYASPMFGGWEYGTEIAEKLRK